MPWKDIPQKPYWQFKTDPVITNRDYLGRETSRLEAQNVSEGVIQRGGNQFYVQTRYVGPGAGVVTDGANLGEISATFYNKEIKPTSFFSSLPEVGGGGGGGADPDFANVVALFKTPSVGSISDVTGTLGTPTIVSNAVVNSSRTKFQTAAMNFTGTDGYIEVPYNGNQTSLDFGTGAFTVECWTYRAGDGTNGTGPYDAIMSTNINGSAGWGLFVKRAGQRVAWRSPTGPTTFYEDTVDFQLPLNAWAHVAVSSEGSGGNIRMFIDGVERFSVAAPTGNQNTSPSALNTAFQIGRQEDEQNRRYGGYVEDIRITKGVARYTAAFTPPTAEFPSS